MSLSPHAFMSITCNILESYTLQVIAISETSPTSSRLFLSDGSVYMCADIPRLQIQSLRVYSLVSAKLSFKGIGVPLQVLTIQHLLPDAEGIIGNPIPYIEFMKNGFKPAKPDQLGSQCLQIQIIHPLPSQDIPDPLPIQEASNLQHASNYLCDQNNSSHSNQADSNQKTVPISQNLNSMLNAYVSFDILYQGLRGWKIIGRVIWKDLKIISSARNKYGNNQVLVLNFSIINQRSETILCSAFDESASKWKEFIQKGALYEFSGGKIVGPNNHHRNLSIQFGIHAEISHIPDSQQTKFCFPNHTQKLTSFDQLNESMAGKELDVCGIVKVILSREESPNNKLNVKIVLADPRVGKEIDVLLNVSSDLQEQIRENMIVILTNLKISKSQDGTISLRSGFKTDVITSFCQDQDEIEEFRPFLEPLRLNQIQLTSLSHSYYKPRTLKQHFQTIAIAPPETKIYSRINLIFHKPSENNKSFYEGCIKCSKKMQKNPTRKSNYCSNYTCRKIVDTVPQYCLRLCFINTNNSIQLTLFREIARSFVGISCEQFAAMSAEEQQKLLFDLRLKQVSVCIFSTKTIGDPQHQISSMSQPETKLQLELITQILDSFPSCVKQETEW